MKDLYPQQGIDGEYWVMYKGKPVKTFLTFQPDSYGVDKMFSLELWESFNSYSTGESFYATREDCVAENNRVILDQIKATEKKLENLKSKLII